MGRLRLAAVALALIAAPCHAAENLSQLIQDVRTLTLDTAVTGNPHFSNSQITTLLNQAQREILAGNHCIQQSLVFSLTLGATYYPLPSNFLVVERVLIGSKMIPQYTPAALDSQSLGWEISTGYPNRYFINFSSRGLVGFAPFPQQSTDTDTIKVDYDVQANDLVNGGDYPFNGINEFQDYQHALAYWAASVIEQLDQQPALSGAYMAVYENVAKVMATRCRDLKNYMPSASGAP
jgi:hypothetical protein